MFTTTEMDAVFSRDSRLQRMLDFEAALARAEARTGIIPEVAAAAIADSCRVELLDGDGIDRRAVVAGTPAIPLVEELTALVDEAARGYVHWGATSQDVIDTGMVLQMRDGIDLLLQDLLEVGATCADLAEEHRAAPMAGRTFLQHALPITFGLKAAHWLVVTTRSIQRLRRVRDACLPLQFGGAAGTLAALRGDGLAVAEQMAKDLGLNAPELPWHTDRDMLLESVAAVGIAAGAMSKIAGDAVLLMQTEVGELFESAAEGKGGSSTMPQKRNPVDAPAALASARLALGAVGVVLNGSLHEHERAVGAWQAEWTAVPDAFRFTSGAVRHVRSMLEGVEVETAAMERNLEATRGRLLAESLAMKLAVSTGKARAHAIVAEASARSVREDRDLEDVAAADERITSVLGRDDIAKALDPASYLGSTDAFIDRAVGRFREVAAR